MHESLKRNMWNGYEVAALLFLMLVGGLLIGYGIGIDNVQ